MIMTASPTMTMLLLQPRDDNKQFVLLFSGSGRTGL